MKATEQDFPVMLFVMLYRTVLTFESVDDILKCDYPDAVIILYKVVLPFESVDGILANCDHKFFKMLVKNIMNWIRLSYNGIPFLSARKNSWSLNATGN